MPGAFEKEARISGAARPSWGGELGTRLPEFDGDHPRQAGVGNVWRGTRRWGRREATRSDVDVPLQVHTGFSCQCPAMTLF